MVDFDLSEDQRMIREMVHDFAQDVVAPRAHAVGVEGEFPEDNVKEMAKLGLMGMMVPEEWGGSGADTVSYVLAMEEVNRACASTGVTMSVNNSLVCLPILTWGTDDLKERYLRDLAQGRTLGAYCLSEPNAGSDPKSMKSTAVEADDGDAYVLNGSKNFITNGGFADTYIVFAKTSPEEGHRGITAFVCEKEWDGFSTGPLEKKLGIKGSSTTTVHLDDCRVPKENVLGEVDRGFYIAMETLNGGRIGIASQAVGITMASLDASVAYANEREAFGNPIADFQAIQWKIADMGTRLDAAHLLTLRAAWMKDEGMDFVRQAATAKLFASETAMWAADQAVQIHGGSGYLTDHPVERYMRDAKITTIYEGTSEIQRLIIAKTLLEAQDLTVEVTG